MTDRAEPGLADQPGQVRLDTQDGQNALDTQHAPGGDRETGRDAATTTLAAVVRAEHGRMVGALVRRFGDLQLAEDAVSDALEVALNRWPTEGVPANPAGWLTTTATRRGLDRLRRESGRDDREREATSLAAVPSDPLGAVDDDRLRLLFMCCHPALAPQTRIALTLRLVCGLSVAEISAGLLVPERTLAQRLTRAKRKIRDTRIPFRIPERDDLPTRLESVLAALYLTFNESYLAHGGAGVRPELGEEAVRLARQLVAQLPAEPEPQGLLALLLLTQARDAARVVEGRLVPLDRQDRERWDRDLLAEGRAIVRALLAIGRPGPYQVQAAIAAAHTDSVVCWAEVVALYDLLLTFTASPVVKLNRALAQAQTEGAAAALESVDVLPLSGYHPWHVARAHLLDQLGRPADARDALRQALALDPTPLERAHLEAELASR